MISIYLSHKRNILDRKTKHQSCRKVVRKNDEHEFALTKELKIGGRKCYPMKSI